LVVEEIGEEHCEFLEIPGNGELFNLQTPTDAKTVIEHLRNKSKFIQAKKKVRLCGISLGGMISLKWLEMYPDEVEYVFAVNSSLHELSKFHNRLNAKLYPKIISMLLSNNPEKQQRFILEVSSNEPVNYDKYEKSFSDFAKRCPVSLKSFVSQLLLAKEIRIKKVDHTKATIIYSENDRLVDQSCSKAIAEKFNLKLLCHKTAGHDLPLDAPHWLMEHILNS
jgi:alpha-beta hydrolase superfamily lysophospholipase